VNNSDISLRLKKLKGQVSPATLLAVSKTVATHVIRNAYMAGQRDFGENRAADLLKKSLELSDLSEIRWHMIGHIQKNKLKTLLQVRNLVAIHSIDSLELLNALIDKKQQMKHNLPLDLYLQVKLSDEEEKGGYDNLADLQESIELLIRVSDQVAVTLRGLMGMGKIRSQNFTQDARQCFLKLRQMRDQLNDQFHLKLDLNMGMSADYLLALECGSNLVRIGSLLFEHQEAAELSLLKFLQGDATEKNNFAQQLQTALDDSAYVVLQDVPIDAKKLQFCRSLMHEFFNLTPELKSKYLPVQSDAGPDLIEYWSVDELNLNSQKWPLEVESFKKISTEVFHSLSAMARTLLGALLPELTSYHLILNYLHLPPHASLKEKCFDPKAQDIFYFSWNFEKQELRMKRAEGLTKLPSQEASGQEYALCFSVRSSEFKAD